MTDKDSYIPFSQRNGLAPTPPQLELGQVSTELRRLLDYYVGLEIERVSVPGFDVSLFNDKWNRVAMDLHVLFFKRSADSYERRTYHFKKQLSEFFRRSDIGLLFDLIEFLVRHKGCSGELKDELASAFVAARAAYRIVDNQIIAIGTEEQAFAFEKALSDAEFHDARAAKRHLVAAGLALRNSDWPGSIRESIHAVEAMAIQLAPGTKELGPALTALEKKGHLHGALKSAFGSLYGYASDERGVRHALVLKDEAQVDEADALFMLGSCAAFVSYLIARNN